MTPVTAVKARRIDVNETIVRQSVWSLVGNRLNERAIGTLISRSEPDDPRCQWNFFEILPPLATLILQYSPAVMSSLT